MFVGWQTIAATRETWRPLNAQNVTDIGFPQS